MVTVTVSAEPQWFQSRGEGLRAKVLEAWAASCLRNPQARELVPVEAFFGLTATIVDAS